MEFICKKGGKVTQKEIEHHLAVSHPTTVGIVSRLQKTGLVDCFVDDDDRRNKIVCATDKAYEIENLLFRHIKETENRLTDGFSADDISNLRNLLYRIYENLKK
ncbi:MAG: MarR family transcriptional regulator [Clostridiales bacterium]|nr:MarR family transcriptional regulator [Clostridiales bacterium]